MGKPHFSYQSPRPTTSVLVCPPAPIKKRHRMYYKKRLLLRLKLLTDEILPLDNI